MTSKGQTLRDRQIDALKTILNLNREISDKDKDKETQDHKAGLIAPSTSILNSDGEPVWKVLIFDDLGRDVISSVLRVRDLRSMGVTMHMHIASARQPIEGVPAIYLLEPNRTNLQAITSDMQKGLYTPVYINFLSSIPRPLLEEFADMTLQANTADHVGKILDQYLNFIVSESDLFNLGMEKQHTYWALNSARTKDEELDLVVDNIVSGLYSVCVTMGVIPIIRCPKGAAAEMISAKLDRKLRDHILNSKGNPFAANNRASVGSAHSRPVLVILDRNVDLIPMFSHSWTYQSLVNDVLNMKLNRITLETLKDEKDPSRGKVRKSYDLVATDFFWRKNAGAPFPQVAEDIDAELTKYKDDAADVTRKTGMSDLENPNFDDDGSAGAQQLKVAITLLPELRERKSTLDMHMNILAALLEGIKNRKLDGYFQMEENVVRQSKDEILKIIRDNDFGNNPIDKLRYFIIWLLSTEADVNRTERADFERALTAAGVDGSCLAYIWQVRSTTKMTQLATINSSQTGNTAAGSGSDLFGRFSSISSRLTDRLKETGVSTNLGANLDSLIGGIKTFLPVNKDFTVTKIVESIMDPSTASSKAIAKTENYLYFDPRSANARGTMPPASAARTGGVGGMPGGTAALGVPAPGTGASFGQRRQGFTEAVVFMVGGGSMDEYGNLQEWVARTAGPGARTRRHVVYGSTEMFSSTDFIQQELERLGKEVESA